MAAAKWAQKTIVVPAKSRGCHLITPYVVKQIEQDLVGFKCGLAHLFLQHTSASLTINENYDSDVLTDTETFLNNIVPEGKKAPWKHTMEGPDDMPAHIKSSMFGCSVTDSEYHFRVCDIYFLSQLTYIPPGYRMAFDTKSQDSYHRWTSQPRYMAGDLVV